MSNDYFISFINMCVKTLNDTHCETERVYYIYKENNPFQLFWVDFFFPKMPSIFNTNNTCNNR